MGACILSAVATDVLALNNQADQNQVLSADQISVALTSFIPKHYIYNEQL